MGYITKDIAVITEPKRVSLSALPNFVQFKSKDRVQSAYVATIQVNALAANAAASVLNIVEPSGAVHSFRGTADPAEVGGDVFFISSDQSDTAENLRQALLSDPWVEANFNIKLPFVSASGVLSNGRVLTITSNGYGAEFNIAIAAPGNVGNVAYAITLINGVSQNGDSISGEASTIEISLDVYIDAPILLGADDTPTSAASLGNFAVSLSKTYAGDPLWFDVNGPFSKSVRFNAPAVAGWFDTGTMRVFRFIARVAGINNYSFYQSSALYVLGGYGLASDPVNLEDYVYANEKITLLTNKPRTPYVKGQREYLNFVLSKAATRSVNILYRAFTSANELLGEVQSDAATPAVLSMVNTCVLNIDSVLDNFPTAGLIRVSLASGNVAMSNELEYMVRPSALHTLRQFSFINRLGGWDSFNFDAAISEDIKATFDTYTKTVTPAHTKSEGIETVYAAQLENTITVVGAPVTDDVAEWLKELAASTVVLDSDGNYVIKLEFTTPTGEGTKNMQVPTMKYKLSETYTNE